MKFGRLFVCKSGEKPGILASGLNLLLVYGALILFFGYSMVAIGYIFDFSFILQYKTRLLNGFLTTVYISLGSLVLSLVIGTLSAIGQGSKILFVRYLCNIYVKFIRGTPLMMQIYLFFYIVGTAWGIENRFVAGILILSVFEGAYISEIIRGSLLSIDESQLEAAKAVGFTSRQTVSYVILPQLIARTLPALTGQFASIIKDSSLLSLIAVIELTQTTREISADTFKLFECYLMLGVLYLCLTLPISFISSKLERRFRYEA